MTGGTRTRTTAYLQALAAHAGLEVGAIRPPQRQHVMLNGLRMRYLV